MRLITRFYGSYCNLYAGKDCSEDIKQTATNVTSLSQTVTVNIQNITTGHIISYMGVGTGILPPRNLKLWCHKYINSYNRIIIQHNNKIQNSLGVLQLNLTFLVLNFMKIYKTLVSAPTCTAPVARFNISPSQEKSLYETLRLFSLLLAFVSLTCMLYEG